MILRVLICSLLCNTENMRKRLMRYNLTSTLWNKREPTWRRDWRCCRRNRCLKVSLVRRVNQVSQPSSPNKVRNSTSLGSWLKTKAFKFPFRYLQDPTASPWHKQIDLDTADSAKCTRTAPKPTSRKDSKDFTFDKRKYFWDVMQSHLQVTQNPVNSSTLRAFSVIQRWTLVLFLHL